MPEHLGNLGKYQILGIIGRGGMGTVYRAFDPVLSRPVALKVVSSEGDLSAEQKARLLREGKACAQLTHPNVISIHDLGEDGGRIFIVMELLQGEDLKQVIAAHAALSLAEKLSLMVQVCDGLHYAHQNGIVHRDIKPANIFVLPNQLIKILDFGLAHLASGESSLTQTGQIVGTLAYTGLAGALSPGPKVLRSRSNRAAAGLTPCCAAYSSTASRPLTFQRCCRLIERSTMENPPFPG
jgi:serine/threonine-protein kinase